MFDEHERAEFELTADLASIERQLARLTPAAPRIDRDRLMFDAGKASSPSERPAYVGDPSRPGFNFWRSCTALATAVCLFLATMLVWQRQAVRVVEQPPAPPSTVPLMDPPAGQSLFAASEQIERAPLSRTAWPAKPSTGYLGIRNMALARGVNAIDIRSTSAAIGGSEPADVMVSSQRKLLDELLPPS